MNATATLVKACKAHGQPFRELVFTVQSWCSQFSLMRKAPGASSPSGPTTLNRSLQRTASPPADL